VNIDSLLQPFQHFGVHLGLERISKLLRDLGNPQDRVPIVHVAGTNGKGSVCAYLSSILTEAGYKVGRYISPHLVDWTERISIDLQPISTEELERSILEVRSAIDPQAESPTQFEVITAAAWLYFAQNQVDLAVIEVGLGGRLDATNVCDRPLVSIITSLSLEHWQVLGPTLADIAREKAGILKTNCPAVVGKLPPDAREAVAAKIAELNCPVVWVESAIEVETEKENRNRLVRYQEIEYYLPLLGDIQLTNSAIAIAAIQILQERGWHISNTAIQQGIAKTHWSGRLQWTSWRDRQLLVDGAHNPAAAIALRQYVDTLNVSITWVMGMLSTKDHADIFSALLRPGDSLYLVPVPDHSSAEPETLAKLAKKICPQLNNCQTFPELTIALNTAINDVSLEERSIVLCGSLYLVGYFLKLNRKTQ
jgi:dihydrofolate synthase/folylpolyglutamate synthase